MNFLAHLVLAPDTPEGMVGALAPDLVRGPLPADLHPAVRAAALEHQHIDRVTDAHPAFLDVKERLHPAFARFAGIVADVLFDHALASRWDDYGLGQAEPLPDYAERVGRTYADRPDLMPERMWRITTRRMTGQRWLTSYATPQGMRLTLARMSGRFSKRLGIDLDLAPAADLLTPRPGWLDTAFGRLWPDLREQATRFRADHLDQHPAQASPHR